MATVLCKGGQKERLSLGPAAGREPRDGRNVLDAAAAARARGCARASVGVRASAMAVAPV